MLKTKKQKMILCIALAAVILCAAIVTTLVLVLKDGPSEVRKNYTDESPRAYNVFLNDGDDEVEIGAVPVRNQEGDPFTASGGSSFVIPASAENPSAACAWAIALTSPDAWIAAADARAKKEAMFCQKSKKGAIFCSHSKRKSTSFEVLFQI